MDNQGVITKQEPKHGETGVKSCFLFYCAERGKKEKMSNSSLVNYTKLSPNNSGKRTHSIDRITPHCVVGQLSVETLGGLFARSNYQASCNYAIGSDGRVALIVDEGKRSWCSSSNANDQRAVTIECASEKTSPYAFNSTVYNKLVDLCVDICRRNGKNKLIWISDKNTALNYSPKSGEMLLTVHRWFANKSCPGDWLMARMGSLASVVTARLGGAAGSVIVEPRSLSKGDEGDDVKKMQTMLIALGYSCGSYGADGDFGSATDSALRKYQANKGLTVDGVYGPKSRAALEADYKNRGQNTPAAAPTTATKPYTEAFIDEIAPLAKADMAKTGICAAVTIAQAILESGWGRSDLAKNAHNLFGMKKNLSGNTWSGSTWDGKRVCTKDTKEVYSTGTATVSAEFRVYNSYAESVGDHSAYLAGAKNGSALRFAGAVGQADYKKAAQIIKNGGYATAPDYVDKICRIVEQYNLTRFNVDYQAPKQQESAKQTEIPQAKAREIHVFYPGYTRTSSPDDRQGAGCVWHDQNGKTIVIDAYWKTSAAAKRLVDYLIDNGLRTIDFVGTHAHADHLGGGFKIFEDGRIKVENVYVDDPNSLKLAGTGSANARSAKEDKEYLQKFINTAKQHGAAVHYVGTGNSIKCGEIEFDVYRNQPTKWSEYDTGEAWAYLNDGSICLYSRQSYYITAGDADASQFVEKYNLTVKGAEVGHHGNNGNRTSAKIYVAHGCIFAIQCNHEKNSPGSCEFTRYGSGRMKEAGVKVWQLDADIHGVIKAGKATFTQGGKSVSWTVPFAAVLYRVRKTWADAKSQIGAYSILDNAKKAADAAGAAYAVFDVQGKEIYRPGKNADSGQISQPQPAPAPAPTPAKPQETQVKKDGLFRVRKNWNDAKSQVGAYRNPKSAIAKAKASGGSYEVYDDYGVPVYPDSYKTGFFRVRKTWADSKSQVSAHKYLEKAIETTDAHKGYSLFDNYGRKIYPV